MAALLMLVGCAADPPASELETADGGAGEEEDDAGPSDKGDDSDRADGAADDDGDDPQDASDEEDGAASDRGDDDEPRPPPPDEGSAEDVFFRIDSFVLRSPGVVVRPLLIEIPITTDVQTELDKALVGDLDPVDGYVDVSLFVRFLETGDPAKKAGKATFGGGLCPHPLDPAKACEPDETVPFQYPGITFSNDEDCKLEGTAELASGRCFASEPSRLSLALPLLGQVPLEGAQVIGSWVDDGEGGIENGWVRGFLSQETAKATKISGELPPIAATVGIVEGTPLATFFPDAELSSGPSGKGWWFLVKFSAQRATFASE